MASGGGGVPFSKKPWYKKIFLFWTPDGSHAVADYLWEWAFDPIVIMPIGVMLLLILAGAVDPGAVSGTLAMVIALSPVWLPISLFIVFWVTWIHYIRYGFWFKQKFVLLEVQLPPEVEKTPLAMELFITSMWNSGGEATFMHRIWRGSFRAVWSLEIASNEGQIRFYIHLRDAFKKVIEARLYGQFPEARVTEVDDYVARVPYNPQEYDLFGVEFKKADKPGDGTPGIMPIKTYVDYGLDKNPDKPENQVDPITNLTELLGQIGQGEYMWLQIIIKAQKKDEWYGFYKSGEPHYLKNAKDGLKAITKAAIDRAQSFVEDDDEKKKVGQRGSTLLSPMERLRVEAIERALTKSIFEVGIRVLYVSKKDKTAGINNGHVVRFFDAYRQPGYNSIGPARGMTDFDYPWQDWGDIRADRVKKNQFFRYKHRAYFYVPYDQVPSYMTTEELATLWHFPSSVVATPALDRVPSKRSEAPINLPI
jgi:hypothetical protein